MLLSKIRIPKTEVLPGGSFRDFVMTQVLFGYVPSSIGDDVEVRADLAHIQPSFNELKDIVQSGGYFENVKLGLRFTSAASANRDVPSSVRGYQYADPDNEGELLTHTFLSWIKQFPNVQVLKETAGTAYICKALYFEEWLNSDELKDIHTVSGVNVIEWSEVQESFSQIETGEWEVVIL